MIQEEKQPDTLHHMISQEVLKMLEIVPNIDFQKPPQRVVPASFEELYANRHLFLNYQQQLGRNPNTYNQYHSEQVKSVAEMKQIVVDFFYGGQILENDKRVVIAPDNYPAELPFPTPT